MAWEMSALESLMTFSVVADLPLQLRLDERGLGVEEVELALDGLRGQRLESTNSQFCIASSRLQLTQEGRGCLGFEGLEEQSHLLEVV